jgi:DNA helicase-2/ATP-dependent DNA helicase PcrA
MSEPSSVFTPKGIRPTREQSDVQLARQKTVLVDANAGAAKTTTLALRIGQALVNRLPGDQILALAFTNPARDVLRQRLLDIGLPRETVALLKIATFEDFASEVLQAGEERCDWCPTARHLKKYVLQAIHSVHDNYAHKFDFLQIDEHDIAVSQFLDAQLHLKATMGMDAEFDLDDLDTVYDRFGVTAEQYLTALEYERIRLGHQDTPLFRGPFDATYDLARSLHAGDGGLRLPAYSLILCDELHDMNEAAFRILNAMIRHSACWFVGVGDRDQVILKTLGASNEFLTSRFRDAYPAAKSYPLTLTYRHGPHLAYAVGKFKSKEVESHLPLRTELAMTSYDGSAEDCAKRVVGAIQAWKKDGNRIEDCAILLRGWHQSVAVENALMQAKIGYRTPPKMGYLQRDEILFLRGIMAIALDGLGAVKAPETRKSIVEALAIFGELRLAADTLDDAAHEIAKSPGRIIDFYGRYIRVDESRAGAGTTRLLDQTIRHARELPPEVLAGAALQEIAQRMNLEATAKRIYVRPHDARVVAKSIAGFIDAATASQQTLAEFWAALTQKESFANKKWEKDFVTLDSVENAKGREFGHVIMPFLARGEFPSPLFQRGEEENLWYVGITRTRTRLTLLAPKLEADRSEFIAQMQVGAVAEKANAALRRNEGLERQEGPTRHYLKAGYAQRETVKALGAKWDATRKSWYVEVGMDLGPFADWL